MITIPFIIVLTILAYFLGSFIRKHNSILYITTTIIAALMFIVRYKVPITEPFVQGYLGLSFLYIVMVAGALKDKSKLQKKLLSIRREYSIMGFILISPHAFKYIFEFLRGDIAFTWFGVIPYLIMIPLFITSFMIVRKKFTFKQWQSIQKFAYIVYILIFVHLIIVAKMPNLLVYIILFTPYIIFKLLKEYGKIKKIAN